MISSNLSQAVFALSERDRLELARLIVESIASDAKISESIDEGVSRIEDIVSGKVVGHTKEEYLQASR